MANPVDEFLRNVPDPERAALEALRTAVRNAAPGASELINYGVPMFRLNGRNLVGFAAGKDHCSFFVQSPAVMEAHAADLKGFKTSKGTVQFSADKRISVELVTRLVKARIAENEAAADVTR